MPPFLVLYTINPLMSLILAFRTGNYKIIRIVMTLFIGFSGTCIYYMGDNQRYRDKFFKLNQLVPSWDQFASGFYNDAGKLDVYVHFIIYFLSLFTANEKILFGIFGLIFGYFFSSNLILILNYSDYNNNKLRIILIYILSFCFIYPFWSGLNAVRFPLATHLFFWSYVMFLKKNDYRYLFGIFMSVFIHFSYIYFCLIIFIFIFLRIYNYQKLLYIYFAVSFIPVFEFEVIKSAITVYLPNFYESKVDDYTSDHFILERTQISENWSIFKILSENLLLYITPILISVIYFSREKSQFSKILNNILSLILFLYGTTNYISSIPSIERFYMPIFMFSFLLFAHFLGKYGANLFFKIATVPLFFILIFDIRKGLDFITPNHIIGNLFFSFLRITDDINLYKLIF